MTQSASLSAKFRLDGRVAIVTGASKGIGAAIAHAFAEAGAGVVVSSRRQDAVDMVASEIVAKGGTAIGVAAHAGEPIDLERLVEATMEQFGRIDVVVNNAATNPAFGPLLEATDDLFDKVMNVNLRGPLTLSRIAHPYLAASGRGSIVNISSVEGLSPSEGLALYSVSKAALISLTGAMAREWGGAGIRVNAICPGLIQTKFSAALWKNETIRQSFLAHVPSGRMGQPDEIAALALFLASDAGSYCTGGTYVADGGYLI